MKFGGDIWSIYAFGYFNRKADDFHLIILVTSKTCSLIYYLKKCSWVLCSIAWVSIWAEENIFWCVGAWRVWSLCSACCLPLCGFSLAEHKETEFCKSGSTHRTVAWTGSAFHCISVLSHCTWWFFICEYLNFLFTVKIAWGVLVWNTEYCIFLHKIEGLRLFHWGR